MFKGIALTNVNALQFHIALNRFETFFFTASLLNPHKG